MSSVAFCEGSAVLIGTLFAPATVVGCLLFLEPVVFCTMMAVTLFIVFCESNLAALEASTALFGTAIRLLFRFATEWDHPWFSKDDGAKVLTIDRCFELLIILGHTSESSLGGWKLSFLCTRFC